MSIEETLFGVWCLRVGPCDDSFGLEFRSQHWDGFRPRPFLVWFCSRVWTFVHIGTWRSFNFQSFLFALTISCLLRGHTVWQFVVSMAAVKSLFKITTTKKKWAFGSGQQLYISSCSCAGAKQKSAPFSFEIFQHRNNELLTPKPKSLKPEPFQRYRSPEIHNSFQVLSIHKSLSKAWNWISSNTWLKIPETSGNSPSTPNDSECEWNARKALLAPNRPAPADLHTWFA